MNAVSAARGGGVPVLSGFILSFLHVFFYVSDAGGRGCTEVFCILWGGWRDGCDWLISFGFSLFTVGVAISADNAE